MIGCDSIQQLEQNVQLAREFTPLSRHQMASLAARGRSRYRTPALFFRLAAAGLELEIDYLGGESVEEGAGLPSIVSISIISTRVPSGSNRPTCRLLSTPMLIFSSRA